MADNLTICDLLHADSFLEYAFLQWVLTPAVVAKIVPHIIHRRKIIVDGRSYHVDYAIEGINRRIVVELYGFAYHNNLTAFTYDRLRQNDLQTAEWTVVRFSYDAIRNDTARCVQQLQEVLRLDPLLSNYCIAKPKIEHAEMSPDPLAGIGRPQHKFSVRPICFFDIARTHLRTSPLRDCQVESFSALSNYYSSGGRNAACVMSVGAGKTVLGLIACIAFTRQRALVVTPSNVIRGTFDKAFDHQRNGNSLYGLPGGPVLPGCMPPNILTLDREDGPIRQVTRAKLLAADIIITNFHSLGTGDDQGDLLSKLCEDDIDFIVIDEAHIAAAESYQRTFSHFRSARTLLMSACFQRLDGKTIDADVVYSYRLIDSIADGYAKTLRVHRFAPNAISTIYEMVWPDGNREEIIGREALLAIINDERKLARITAKSDASIRMIMRTVQEVLKRQTDIFHPIKPRVLFSALGEQHAKQIAQIAEEHGIACSYLHHSMSDARIKATRDRFEHEYGDLQGIVQLKMLGQGYDFPPIAIVVPMRPYGSFSEFYQFIGRGIRVLQPSTLSKNVPPSGQYLDIVYHAELGLDQHIETIYHENGMDPCIGISQVGIGTDEVFSGDEASSCDRFDNTAPETFVLVEHGSMAQRVIQDEDRIEQRRTDREREAFAQRYAQYVQTTKNPVSFERYIQIIRMTGE